jgi:hypothetical protein
MNISKTLLVAALGGVIVGATGCGEKPAAAPTGTSDPSVTAPAGGGATPAAPAAKHACKGQNACKGQGGCKTDKNGCKGQNACKGQGGCKTA